MAPFHHVHQLRTEGATIGTLKNSLDVQGKQQPLYKEHHGFFSSERKPAPLSKWG